MCNYQPLPRDIMETDRPPVSYVGFWARVLAQIVDTVLGALIIFPLLYGLYGSGFLDFGKLRSSPLDYLLAYQPQTGPLDFVISYVLPAVAIIAFWLTRQATPGKMLVSARVVDAVTLGKIGTGQAIGRYLGYYVCILSLGFGFLWVAIDPRKQGWHDKLAATLVIKVPKAPV
jgi:uncharacterized RDD family membrane protein YckC